MEALLEKEGDVENWNDDRLDELSQTMKEGFAESDREMREGFAKVDRRFERVEGEMKEGFERVDRRFERVDDRLDKLFYIQILFLISFSAALITHSV